MNLRYLIRRKCKKVFFVLTSTESQYSIFYRKIFTDISERKTSIFPMNKIILQADKNNLLPFFFLFLPKKQTVEYCIS